MSDATNIVPRRGKELFEATAAFAAESWGRSWWHVGSTLVVLAAVLTCAALAPWWPLRLIASIIGGLVLVRAFILYHDFMHGALLSGSRVAQVLFCSLGAFMLTPESRSTFSPNGPKTVLVGVTGVRLNR